MSAIDRELRDELEISGDEPGDVAHVPGPALAATLAEFDRLRAVEARYVAQVHRVLPYVPGPDPDDQSEDFDERVIAALQDRDAEVVRLRSELAGRLSVAEIQRDELGKLHAERALAADVARLWALGRSADGDARLSAALDRLVTALTDPARTKELGLYLRPAAELAASHADLDARTVGAVPALLAMCTAADEGVLDPPAVLTAEVRSVIAAAVPGGLTAELERLRARVAELEAEHERVQDFHHDRLTGSPTGSPARMWAEQLGDAIAGRYMPDQAGRGLRTQLAAARGLHTPESGWFPPTCRTCVDADEQPTAWPCATAAALGATTAAPWTDPWGATS